MEGIELKEFSKDELARCNGKNGAPAYIAYRGDVYDVSTSFIWKNGNHEVVHSAGMDLTDSMEQAPHSADLLEKFPLVGTLQTKDA
ncbi:MAG: cytochrome b5 domain-containing protein [archaeon]